MKIGESDAVRGVRLVEEDPLLENPDELELEAECVLVDIYDIEETDERVSRYDAMSDSGSASRMIPFLMIGVGLVWLASNVYGSRK